MNFEIKNFETKTTNRGLFNSFTDTITTAIVKMETGDWIGVSRWSDEDYWVVDCRFTANGFPVFSNGEGSRVTVAHTLASDHEVTKTLDKKLEDSK